MNGLSARFPLGVRLALAMVLGMAALFVSGLIESPGLRTWFPFTATILLVLVTSAMYHTEGRSLTSLGLNLSRRHLAFLFIGLALGGMALAFENGLRLLYTGEHWQWSSHRGTGLWKDLYYILPMAAV